MPTAQHESKTRLLDAAMNVIRAKGYTATTVDEVCQEAGVTKGSFFHHFKSKEELALQAAEHFAEYADAIFEEAPFHRVDDPRQRLLGYVDLRREMIQGDLKDFTCLLGTMAQETYRTHPSITAACGEQITAHAATLLGDIAQARRQYQPGAEWSEESLAMFAQAVIQGAFVLAKAKNDPKVASDSLAHLRRYLELLFAEQPELPDYINA